MKKVLTATLLFLVVTNLSAQITGTPYMVPSTRAFSILLEVDSRLGNDFYPGGSQNPELDDKLLNPNNFGPSGIFRCINLNIETILATDTITSEILSQHDVFMVTYIRDQDYTDAERDAVFNWVTNENGVLLAFEDDDEHNPMGSRFGLGHDGFTQINSNGGPIELENGYTQIIPSQINHPLFDNVFGTVTNNLSSYAYVANFNVPDPNDFTVLARNVFDATSQPPTIVSYNHGNAVFFGDEGILRNTYTTVGGDITSNTDRTFANMIAWALSVRFSQ